jgi:hypothetical protein
MTFNLTDGEFEELTYDLLHALGFVNLDWRQPAARSSTRRRGTTRSDRSRQDPRHRSDRSHLPSSPLRRTGADLPGTWAGDGPAQPPQTSSTLSLNAALRGALTRITGTPRIGWRLMQSGSNVTGSVTVSVGGTPALAGALTGTYANGALRYSVSVPEGAVSIAPGCAGIIDGLATVSATELAGSAWVRVSTCVAPLATVGFSLTKQ